MLQGIYQGITNFTNWAWSLPVLIFLIGGGLWMTLALGCVQICRFGAMLKHTIGNSGKQAGDGKEGGISGFQAVTAALAAVLGTGNIVGVGTAIAAGGPGAVFWLWVTGFVAMALKYAEAVLSVACREKRPDGTYKGGASYYLSQVWKPLGILWAIFMTVSLWIAAGVHTGSVVTAAGELGVPKMVSTVIVVIVITVIMFGGMSMLVKVTEKLVPFMAAVYLLGGLAVILLNIGNLIPVFVSIFEGAFTGTAATGGFLGATVGAAVRNGCARGMYSSDAGNGQSSIMFAQAEVDHPVEQGFWGIFEVFISSIVVCSFTALVILCTGAWQTGEAGSTLAITAFKQSLGMAGQIIASMGLLLFAGSTLLAFCTFVGMIAENLLGKAARYVSQVMFVILAFVGGTVGVDEMLLWADFGNVFIITFNVIGMVAMTGTIRRLTKEYFAK